MLELISLKGESEFEPHPQNEDFSFFVGGGGGGGGGGFLACKISNDHPVTFTRGSPRETDVLWQIKFDSSHTDWTLA